MKHYTHSYYGYAMRLDRNKIKTSKKKIENFLKLNQLPISTRYQSLYKANILRSRRFLSRIFKTKKEIVRYITKNNPINFKNNEDLNNYEYLGFGICDYNYKKTDLKKIFDKLYQFWKDLD
jgi:hypothetical protein